MEGDSLPSFQEHADTSKSHIRTPGFEASLPYLENLPRSLTPGGHLDE